MLASFLKWCYRDGILDQDERRQVDHLQSILSIDSDAASSIRKHIEQEIFRAEVAERFKDRRLSVDDQWTLSELQQRLGIDTRTANAIKQEVADTVVRQYLNQAVEDGFLSPEEEAEVRLAVSSLGLDLKFTPEQQQRWDRFRLYWDLQFGAMQPVRVDIKLQSSETCYFTAPTQWWESRTETRTIRYGGPTARIRIAKGIYWRTGSMNVQRVTEEVLKPIDTGQLYITNKRVIFLGRNRNTNVRLNRILDFTIYTDGIELVKDAGRNPVFQFDADIDIAALVLNRLLADDPLHDAPSRVEIVESYVRTHQISAPKPEPLPRPSTSQAGFIDGRHYTEYVEEVKRLKRERRHSEVLSLLDRLIDAVETESAETGHPVAPWYYEQMAIVCRKEKDCLGEVRVLQRYEEQRKRSGSPPDSLTERLTKAQALALEARLDL